MRVNNIVRLACIVAAGIAALAACSRSTEAPPSSPPAPAGAAQPAQPPPAAHAAHSALTPDQVARLVRPHSPVLGAANARVTVVEVLDPACEACRAFAPVVKQLLFLHPDDVRVVVRYANFHPPSEEAIRLLVAAGQQGKFDDVLGALFERQEEWASHTGPDSERAWNIAADVGLNVARARKDARAASVDNLLLLESKDLGALKVERTPTFYVNGKLLEDFGPQQLLNLVASEVGKR
jgi:protein-disulfide isomerase